MVEFDLMVIQNFFLQKIFSNNINNINTSFYARGLQEKQLNCKTKFLKLYTHFYSSKCKFKKTLIIENGEKMHVYVYNIKCKHAINLKMLSTSKNKKSCYKFLSELIILIIIIIINPRTLLTHTFWKAYFVSKVHSYFSTQLKPQIHLSHVYFMNLIF